MLELAQKKINMNSIFESNYFWLTVCALLAVLFHYSEKYFHNYALRKKEEFDEFVKKKCRYSKYKLYH